MSAYNNYTPRSQQSNLEWIMVQNIGQVENVAVQPMQRAWIMVQNEPIFALRTADAMGLASTSYYKFEKYEPNAAPGYITEADLETKLKEMEERLNEYISAAASGSNSATEQHNGAKRKVANAED